MQAGKLRHRITIEQRLRTPDTFGELDESWSTLATVWAEIRPTAGTERAAGAQEIGELTHEVRIRHNASVTESCRVKFGSRYFDILAVRNLHERDREQVLHCKERVSA